MEMEMGVIGVMPVMLQGQELFYAPARKIVK
jgi:hypothetical protein